MCVCDRGKTAGGISSLPQLGVFLHVCVSVHVSDERASSHASLRVSSLFFVCFFAAGRAFMS